MAAHTLVKWKLGTIAELMWGCNIASFLIIAGLWTRNATLVGTAFLWHLCVGDPAYLYGAWIQGHTGWTSVVVHSLPTAAAFLYLRRTGIPRTSPYFALVLFLALVPLSHYLTPPRLNINMTHQRLWILQRYFPGNWDYRFAFSSIMLAMLLAGDWGMAKVLGRPKAAA